MLHLLLKSSSFVFWIMVSFVEPGSFFCNIVTVNSNVNIFWQYCISKKKKKNYKCYSCSYLMLLSRVSNPCSPILSVRLFLKFGEYFYFIKVLTRVNLILFWTLIWIFIVILFVLNFRFGWLKQPLKYFWKMHVRTKTLCKRCAFCK